MRLFPTARRNPTPYDRDGLLGLFIELQGFLVSGLIRLYCWSKGFHVGGNQIDAYLDDNVRYAKDDVEKRGISHALDFGRDAAGRHRVVVCLGKRPRSK